MTTTTHAAKPLDLLRVRAAGCMLHAAAKPRFAINHVTAKPNCAEQGNSNQQKDNESNTSTKKTFDSILKKNEKCNKNCLYHFLAKMY